MSDSWDDQATGWDDNEDVIAYSRLAYTSLCEAVELDGLAILDFGCGTGQLTEQMATRAERIVAVDSSAKMVSVLEHKQLDRVETLALEISPETIGTIPRPAAGFDLIVASSVCAFLSNYPETLRLLKQLMRSGGSFVQWDWQTNGEDAEFGLSRELIESAYTEAGLQRLSISQPFSMGPMQVLMGVAVNPE